ncbi:hypothetical protein WG8_1890 [Paenibacillus sp. Aloe-11]|nr:hypothetical protein WG8_1890 [Paenibacillus sp. Aloe-11]
MVTKESRPAKVCGPGGFLLLQLAVLSALTRGASHCPKEKRHSADTRSQ